MSKVVVYSNRPGADSVWVSGRERNSMRTTLALARTRMQMRKPIATVRHLKNLKDALLGIGEHQWLLLCCSYVDEFNREILPTLPTPPILIFGNLNAAPTIKQRSVTFWER